MTAGPGQTSTLERRASARTSIKRFLAELFGRTRSSRADVARSIGTSDTHVDRALDVDHDRQWQLPDALLLTAEERAAIAAVIAGDGHAIVKLPEVAPSASTDLGDAVAAQRETAEALAKHLAAISDGHLDAREGAELERECDEALATILRIRERARAAQRDRVVRLRAVSE